MYNNNRNNNNLQWISVFNPFVMVLCEKKMHYGAAFNKGKHVPTSKISVTGGGNKKNTKNNRACLIYIARKRSIQA